MPHACVTHMALPPGTCVREVSLTPARQRPTNVQKRTLVIRSGQVFDQCRLCGFLLGPTAGTRRKLQHRRSHARRPQRMRFTLWVCRKTRRPRHYCGTCKDNTSKGPVFRDLKYARIWLQMKLTITEYSP